MGRDKDPECRALLFEERPLAIQVGKTTSSARYWIPRSMIAYLRIDRARLPGEKDSVVFTLPEYFIDQKNCWEIVA